MGWTFTTDYNPDTKSFAQYFKDLHTEENEFGKWEILDHAVVGRVCYSALRWTDKKKNVTRVLCAITLFRYCPKDPGGYTLGYKEVSEDMGPYDYKCPLRILELLDPPINDSSKEWRAKVRTFHARKAIKPKIGDIIKFKEGMTFSDGVKRFRFQAERHKKRGIKYRCLEDNQCCRISNIIELNYDFEKRGGRINA